MRAALLIAALLGAAQEHAAPAQAAAESTFVAVGDQSSGQRGILALGISSDGRVVVGSAHSAAGERAFRWLDGTMTDPGPNPGGSSASMAHACSTDGSVIVGNATVTRSRAGEPAQQRTVAFLWTGGASAPLAGLPDDLTFSDAWSASADGSVVVGQLRRGESSRAFTWRNGQVNELPALPDGAVPVAAYAVSADGSVVAGDAEGPNGLQAFRWSQGTMVGLGTLAPGPGASTARGISANGKVVVGQTTSPWGDEAFRWEDGTMTGLGGLSDDHEFFSMARAASADGSIIVGMSESSAGGSAAFIWDRTHGMRSLQDVLVHEHGLDLAGWSLTEATGMSADGSTIIGSGRNALGQDTAWLARLGAPASPPATSTAGRQDPVFGTWTATIQDLLEPGGACVGHDGTIYIADTGHNCLRVFTRDGREQGRWSLAIGDPHMGEPSYLRAPQDVAIGPDGRIFVADTGHDRIVAYSPQGSPLRSWGQRGCGPGQLLSPCGLAVHGSRLIVADTGNDRIVVFDLPGGAADSWGRLGDRPGEFRAPMGVAVDADGAVLVADSGNDRIQRLSSSGTLQSVIGLRGRAPGMFRDPQGIAVMAGQVFVADTGNHRIQVLGSDGAVDYAWGSRAMRPHEGTGRLHFPGAIALAPGGKFAVICESREDRCQVFQPLVRRPLEQITPYLPPPSSQELFGTAMDIDGHFLAVANPDRGGVDVLDCSATPPRRVATVGDFGSRAAQMRRPAGVKLDLPSSQVIVTDALNHRIQFFQLEAGFDRQVSDDPAAPPPIARLSLAIDLTRIRHSRPPGELAATITPGPIERDGDGNLYVLDQANRVVLVFDQRPAIVRVIGMNSQGEHWLRDPVDLALAGDGRLYVIDRAVRGVLSFDPDGGLVGIWLADRVDGRDWTGPQGIAAGPGGIIYMTDDSDRVYTLDEKGRVQARWGSPGGRGIGPGEFFKPRAIAVDASGAVAVLDWGNHRIQMFSADGQFLGACGASMYVRPAAVAGEPD